MVYKAMYTMVYTPMYGITIDGIQNSGGIRRTKSCITSDGILHHMYDGAQNNLQRYGLQNRSYRTMVFLSVIRTMACKLDVHKLKKNDVLNNDIDKIVHAARATDGSKQLVDGYQ